MNNFIFYLLLAKSTLTVTSFEPVNKLPAQSADFSILQIQEIRPGTDVAAAPDGNNLNTVVAPKPRPQNFRAISEIYSSENGNESKNHNDATERLDEKEIQFEEISKSMTKEIEKDERDKSVNGPQGLVWDNCLETIYKNHQRPNNDRNHDMEQADIYVPTEMTEKRKIKNDENEKWNANFFSKKDQWQQMTYNLRKENNPEGRKQQRPEGNTRKPLEKETENIVTTVPIIPITTQIVLEKPTHVSNESSIDVPITENVFEQSSENDWFVKTNFNKIRFGIMPQKETYLVPQLKLDEGFYPFGFMSKFFDLIHPFDFPVGLIKDIVWGNFSFPYSLIHSIKVESAFLICIIIFVCLALIIPAYLLIVVLLSYLSKSRADEPESGALFPEVEETNCNDRLLTFLTVSIVLFCCLFVSGMAISNEQASTMASDSRNTFGCVCSDVATWLSSAARELHHSLVPPIDMVLQAFRDDLRNVDALLGEPIQKTLASESGVDLVLESLKDIIKESEEVSNKISHLRDTTVQAGGLASSTTDRLRDLSRQVINVKQHCMGKDMKLCDTININGLELTMKFDSIMREGQLLDIRTLAADNLTHAITAARLQFTSLPETVSTQTAAGRQNILQALETRRESIYRSSSILIDIVRHLTAALKVAARKFEGSVVRFQNYDFWRWVTMTVCVTIFGLVLLLIMLALMCGCGKAKRHAKRTLKFSTFWIFLCTFVLWGTISAIFLIAGHAEVFVCHALWDSPQYSMLSKLLDRPSPLLEGREGIFDAIFQDLENVTIDVSIKDVLRDCEKDHTVYNVFQLDRVLDVNKETSYFEWKELQDELNKLDSSINIGYLKTVSSDLSSALNIMLDVSKVELSKYRSEYNGPLMGKDLISLADQLENVAAQITDLTTSGRFETLASRTRRLQVTSIKPLEQYKADIVFKLTELELQLAPFRRKLNISLSHIHTAQYYIDNQGDVIAQKKVSIYINRLISHVAGWRTHVLSSTAYHAGRCRPLFDVYHAGRTVVCSVYVASLHGWWMCGALLGLSWCFLTPLCVKMWGMYGEKLRAYEAINMNNLNNQTQETPTTAVYDNRNWNTPGPPPEPPRSDSW